MPRPKNKKELLDLSAENFSKLMQHVDQLPEEEQKREFHPGTMNRNIRDVFAHLHEWHLMMLKWYSQGMAGFNPKMPAPGYTWKTTPDLNKAIWEKYSESKLEQIKRNLFISFQELRKVIELHDDEELFEKKRYHWTGSTSLGSYLISATSSHYDWALKLIKRGLK